MKPLIYKEDYSYDIEEKVEKALFKAIFEPLIDIIHSTVKDYYTNAKDTLIRAIQKGRIQYVDGKFYGSFNAEISKELGKIGASYNKFSGTYSLSRAKLPMDVQQAVGQAIATFEGMSKKLLGSLDETRILDELDRLDFGKEYAQVVRDMNKDFEKASDVVGIAPEFTVQAVAQIAENYSNNMKLYIKNWTKGEILKLRKTVYDNVTEGYRAESLVKGIQTRYGVSQSKAKFLARQETSLLMSNIRETRYKDIGVERYRWSTSHDERVRSTHARLDGKIFTWDSPPIVDDKGNRKHPQQDFGCRCLAVPLSKFQEIGKVA